MHGKVHRRKLERRGKRRLRRWMGIFGLSVFCFDRCAYVKFFIDSDSSCIRHACEIGLNSRAGGWRKGSVSLLELASVAGEIEFSSIGIVEMSRIAGESPHDRRVELKTFTDVCGRPANRFTILPFHSQNEPVKCTANIKLSTNSLTFVLFIQFSRLLPPSILFLLSIHPSYSSNCSLSI